MEKSKTDFLGTDYSSGDSKMMNPKQKYTEENNNEVDELSKEFSEMGCIMDPVKQPSNIGVESCIYEGSGDEENEEADRYSDEFEEDGSVEELKLEPQSAKSETETHIMQNVSSVILTKSQSSMSSKPVASRSGRSTSYGSISVPTTRRVNMSFTNERLREIERHNHILLSKILTARNKNKSSIPPPNQPPKRPPPAAVLRKQMQKKIDHDNMILLKKIQRAKSSACSTWR